MQLPGKKREAQEGEGEETSLEEMLAGIDAAIAKGAEGAEGIPLADSSVASRRGLEGINGGVAFKRKPRNGRPRTRQHSENLKDYDGGAIPPAELRPKHLEIFRLIVTNPAITRKEIAAQLGVSPGWVSVIVNSNLFQQLLADHKEQMISNAGATVYDRTKAAVDLAMGRIIERLEVSSDPDYALDVAKNLGKNLISDEQKKNGQKEDSSGGGLFTRDDLENASEVLVRIKRNTAPLEEGRVNKTRAIDGEATKVDSVESGTSV